MGHGGDRKVSEGHTCQADAEFHQPQEPGNWANGQAPHARVIRQRFHEAIWDHYLGAQWRQALEAETDADSQRP